MDMDIEKTKLLMSCVVNNAILVTLSIALAVSGEVIGLGTEAIFLLSLFLG